MSNAAVNALLSNQYPSSVDQHRLREFLDAKADQYNRPSFIAHDPISIPHRFSRKQDIEIMGFWAAVLAWGQRPVILKKSNELIDLMDGAPYDFVRHHQETDLKRFLAFKHRTFNATDALYFLHFFHQYYQHHDSLEDAFLPDPTVEAAAIEADLTTSTAPDRASSGLSNNGQPPGEAVTQALITFHDRFCCDPFFPPRTRKHIATPARNSSCKRLLMFLRWMVRHDEGNAVGGGVDFGLWKRLRPDQLVMPIDVHVNRVSHKLGLLTGTGNVPPPPNWKTALALTEKLRQFDPADPVRYDFALFGLGVDGEL